MLLSFGQTAAIAPQPADLTVASHDLLGMRPVVRGMLARLLRRPLGHADIDDAEAEVMRRALEGRARLQEPAALRRWVVGIAKHVALDTLRARKRQAPLLAEAPLIADPGPRPDAQLATRRRSQRLSCALQQLPAKQREALVLFHSDGLSYRDIAAQMQVPVGTVCTWVSRARRRLQSALSKMENQAYEPPQENA